MSAVDVRVPLHDKVISILTALKHKNGTDACFASVSKFYATLPESLPAALVLPAGTEIISEGLDFDERIVYFAISIFELIEINASDSDAAVKINRMSNLEDRILSAFQVVPNPVGHTITGIECVDTSVDGSQDQIVQDERGVVMYKDIRIGLHVNIEVKALV